MRSDDDPRANPAASSRAHSTGGLAERAQSKVSYRARAGWALAIGVALVYVGTALVLAVIAASNATKHVAELSRLSALGDAAAAKLELAPLWTLQPLRQACAKVPHVEPDEVLAYFPAAVAERLAALPKDSLFPSQRIFGLDTQRFEIKSVGSPWREDSVVDFLEDLLGDAPAEWGWRKERWNEPFHHPLFGTKVLVVHHLASLEPSRLIGTYQPGETTFGSRERTYRSAVRLIAKEGYEPGEMVFRSAVLDARSGAILCSGLSVVGQKGSVYVSGSGTTKAGAEAAAERNREGRLLEMLVIETHFFALGEACSLGGERLCKLTFRDYQP